MRVFVVRNDFGLEGLVACQYCHKGIAFREHIILQSTGNFGWDTEVGQASLTAKQLLLMCAVD